MNSDRVTKWNTSHLMKIEIVTVFWRQIYAYLCLNAYGMARHACKCYSNCLFTITISIFCQNNAVFLVRFIHYTQLKKIMRANEGNSQAYQPCSFFSSWKNVNEKNRNIKFFKFCVLVNEVEREAATNELQTAEILELSKKNNNTRIVQRTLISNVIYVIN